MVVIPACLPYRRILAFGGICSREIFIGKSKQTITQREIGGIAGAAASPFGLFAKM
jgi:hypothetical protein